MSLPAVDRILNGVIPSGTTRMCASRVRRDGPDTSWLSGLHVGDDQGDSSSCVVHALGNWLEAVDGVFVPDGDCRGIWQETLAFNGRTKGGLTVSEGFAGMTRAGYFQGWKGVEQVYDYERFVDQPFVACYKVLPAWMNMSFEGCFDHSPEARRGSYGNHAVLLGARGIVDAQPDLGRIYTVVNSWKLSWGKNGMGQMAEDLHDEMCFEMWAVNK